MNKTIFDTETLNFKLEMLDTYKSLDSIIEGLKIIEPNFKDKNPDACINLICCLLTVNRGILNIIEDQIAPAINKETNLTIIYKRLLKLKKIINKIKTNIKAFQPYHKLYTEALFCCYRLINSEDILNKAA